MKIVINAPFSRENRELITAAAPGCEFARELSRADIIIGDIPEEHFGKLPRLKWLQLTSAGADRILYGGAVGENVLVTTAGGAFGDVISEYVIGGILALYRDFFTYRDNQRSRTWCDTGRERTLYGERVLVLGCGDLGKNIAKRLRAFGVHTVGIRRSGTPCEFFDEVCPAAELDGQLPLADAVVCALPHTPETDNLLDRRRLALLLENALLVNVGRGTVLDTQALTEMLAAGRLYGAVLDVFEAEPLPENSPLWGLDNVFVTPHISGKSFGHSPRTERLIAEICADNLRRYLRGEPLKNTVQQGGCYNERT